MSLSEEEKKKEEGGFPGLMSRKALAKEEAVVLCTLGGGRWEETLKRARKASLRVEEHTRAPDDLQERLLPAAGCFDKDQQQEVEEEEAALLRSSIEDD